MKEGLRWFEPCFDRRACCSRGEVSGFGSPYSNHLWQPWHNMKTVDHIEDNLRSWSYEDAGSTIDDFEVNFRDRRSLQHELVLQARSYIVFSPEQIKGRCVIACRHSQPDNSNLGSQGYVAEAMRGHWCRCIVFGYRWRRWTLPFGRFVAPSLGSMEEHRGCLIGRIRHDVHLLKSVNHDQSHPQLDGQYLWEFEQPCHENSDPRWSGLVWLWSWNCHARQHVIHFRYA